MKSKQFMSMIVSLSRTRLHDLELMLEGFRVVNERVSVQGKLFGIVVELMRDRFTGDIQDLEQILEFIARDSAWAKELERQADRYQFRSDQAAAVVEEMRARLARIPDE